MSETFISVDIECSGPIVGKHSLLQVGACIVDLPEMSFNAIVQPISDEADAEAMRIVGKPLAYFRKNGQKPRQVLQQFKRWLERDSTPVFVGFNAAFDWSFINWYFLEFIGSNPFGVAPLDIKAYYAGASGVSWVDTRSSRLPDDLKAPGDHTHDALADAIEQADMFRRIRAKYHG
jgi:ribonuclease T